MILNDSITYNLYKLMQSIANIYYSKIIVNMILIISVMSKSLFSLGYIIILCILMYSNQLFLQVDKARKILRPIMSKILIPYMIIEIAFVLVY
jgi:hypothetical protein